MKKIILIAVVTIVLIIFINLFNNSSKVRVEIDGIKGQLGLTERSIDITNLLDTQSFQQIIKQNTNCIIRNTDNEMKILINATRNIKELKVYEYVLNDEGKLMDISQRITDHELSKEQKGYLSFTLDSNLNIIYTSDAKYYEEYGLIKGIKLIYTYQNKKYESCFIVRTNALDNPFPSFKQLGAYNCNI